MDLPENARSLSPVQAWMRFWFLPEWPHTLAFLRICTGAMLAYMHWIWWTDIDAFMGQHAWLDRESWEIVRSFTYARTYLIYLSDIPWALRLHEWMAILFSFMVAIGMGTRWTLPVIWWMTLMVCHRMSGMLFGLDQVVMMLTMYLMLSRCGSVWSVDSWFRDRRSLRSWWLPSADPHWQNRLAVRLIQVHLCVVYLYGGLSKMRGEMWQDGSALWYAAASYEYQAFDLTWIGRHPVLTAVLTHLTIYWETFYVALVWPKWTRPFVIATAILVHLGIAIYLGMITFGTMMILANLSFVSPEFTRRIFQGVLRLPKRESSSALTQTARARR